MLADSEALRMPMANLVRLAYNVRRTFFAIAIAKARQRTLATVLSIWSDLGYLVSLLSMWNHAIEYYLATNIITS